MNYELIEKKEIKETRKVIKQNLETERLKLLSLKSDLLALSAENYAKM